MWIRNTCFELVCCARFQLGARVGAPFLSRHTRVPTVPSWLPPFFAVLHTGRSLGGRPWVCVAGVIVRTFAALRSHLK
jgi:hypothetical protein